MTPEVYIYVLIDPRNGDFRYVGKTNNKNKHSLPQRLNVHLHDTKINHKVSWIKSLHALGLKPTIEVIEECSMADWIEAERFWIVQLRALGYNLTNLAIGGEGSGSTSLETRKKLSELGKTRLSDPKVREKHLERFLSPENQKKKAAALRRLMKIPSERKRIMAKRMATIKTKEYKARFSQIQKNRFSDPVERSRMKALTEAGKKRRRDWLDFIR